LLVAWTTMQSVCDLKPPSTERVKKEERTN
jgi:hypothetical protein